MVKSIKEVGPNRFRETFGRYYEDFEVGHIYEHRPGKTVTEYENHMFTLMTMNTFMARVKCWENARANLVPVKVSSQL